MRMEVREQNKIVELWLTREEKEDAAFRESLKPHRLTSMREKLPRRRRKCWRKSRSNRR